MQKYQSYRIIYKFKNEHIYSCSNQESYIVTSPTKTVT